jgi:transcriptional regulator with XRE-family HTH domain
VTTRVPRDVTRTCPACPWRSKPTTAGLAARALELHSCDRQRRLDAAHVVGDERRARYGTVVRDCEHVHSRHEHGTRNGYVLDRCRCAPCSQAATAYESNRVRQTAYGRWQPYVDAEPARQHVRALMAAGIGFKRVARLAGVSHSSVAKLLYGEASRRLEPSKRIRPETERRLLAVQVDERHLAAGALVPAHETWQHVSGLVALGYPYRWIAQRIGQTASSGLQLGRWQVTVRNAQAIRALAQQVGDTPGPSERARRMAKTYGWLTPMQQYAASFDVDDEDQPADELAPRRSRKETRAEELLEDARWLLDGGLSIELTAERLGITVGHLRELLAGTKGRRAS